MLSNLYFLYLIILFQFPLSNEGRGQARRGRARRRRVWEAAACGGKVVGSGVGRRSALLQLFNVIYSLFYHLTTLSQCYVSIEGKRGGGEFRDATVGWEGVGGGEVSEEEAGGDVSGCRRQRRM